MGRLNIIKPKYPRTSVQTNCAACKVEFWVEPNRLKANRGKFCSLDCKRKNCLTKESKQKMSLAKKGKSTGRGGEKCHFWKGGITPTNKLIRMSLQTRIWRTSVFERDAYTCVHCGEKGGRLQADHIKAFSLFPDLRFEITNGRTLCLECHKNTDTYGGKINRKMDSTRLLR